MGGATLMQHRVSTGCFVSKLGSAGWSPGSSGRARINGGGNGKLVSSSILFGCGVFSFMLLIKLALLALTYTNLKAQLFETNMYSRNAKYILSEGKMSYTPGMVDLSNDREVSIYRE